MRLSKFVLVALTLSMVSPAQTGTAEIRYFGDPAAKLPFSPAVRSRGVVYLSGQIGRDTAGRLPRGIEAQTRVAMGNLAEAARRAGIGLDRIVKCTVMLKDMHDWDAFNTVYLRYFNARRLPARSAFGVNGLAYDALVEVECIGISSR